MLYISERNLQLSYETRVWTMDCPWEQNKFIVAIIKAAAMYTREHLQDTQVEQDIFLKEETVNEFLMNQQKKKVEEN